MRTRMRDVGRIPASGPVGDSWRRFLLVSIGFAMLVVTLGTLNIARVDPMSSLDEFTHLDYAWKVSNGQLPADGWAISPEILELWSCVGQVGAELPVCGTDGPPGVFPLRGENYNSAHPPLYYAVTGLLARVVVMAFPAVDLLSAARWMSLVWVLAGMITFYAALRMLRTPWVVAAAITVVPLSMNTIFTSATIVTSDAPVMLSGALAIIVLTRIVLYERVGWVFPLVIAVLVSLTKFTNAFAVLTIALVLFLTAVVRFVATRDRRELRTLPAAVAVPVGVALVYVPWNVFQNARALPGWTSPVAGISSDPVEGTPIDEWLSTALDGFTNFGVRDVSPSMVLGIVVVTSTIVAVLGVASVVLCLMLYPKDSVEFLLAAAVAVGLLVYPTLIQLQVFLSSSGADYFPNPSSRYGATVHVMMIACLALLASRLRRPGGAIAVAVAASLTAATAVAVITG